MFRNLLKKVGLVQEHFAQQKADIVSTLPSFSAKVMEKSSSIAKNNRDFFKSIGCEPKIQKPQNTMAGQILDAIIVLTSHLAITSMEKLGKFPFRFNAVPEKQYCVFFAYKMLILIALSNLVEQDGIKIDVKKDDLLSLGNILFLELPIEDRAKYISAGSRSCSELGDSSHPKIQTYRDNLSRLINAYILSDGPEDLQRMETEFFPQMLETLLNSQN